jgi:predicted amino acid-binding ACT domain protein
MMDPTEEDIKLIIKLIAEKLGPDASSDKVKSLAAEVIGQLSISTDEKTGAAESKPAESQPQLIIVNAFGPAKEGLGRSLRSFLVGKNLPLVAFSSNDIDRFHSLIAIIDCSNYKSDINPLKFELSELCEKFGFKAIVQNGAYYGSP